MDLRRHLFFGHVIPAHPLALTGRAAASINVISGGSAPNITPDYCEIICDRRSVPGETAAQVIGEHDGQHFVPALPPEIPRRFMPGCSLRSPLALSTLLRSAHVRN
jgi:acetylornithine deacetylase/succinyl-diaminopimelate desuccinylase-like protein